jgi:hypothetical protein
MSSDDMLRTRLSCCCGATLSMSMPQGYGTTFRGIADSFIAAHRHPNGA